MTELPKQYDPKAVEKRRYAEWEEAGYFRGDENAKGEPLQLLMLEQLWPLLHLRLMDLWLVTYS